MAKGFLQVRVYSDTIANPIRNAKVTILKNEKEIFTTTTNLSGQTEKISLDTVDKSYSEEKQNKIRPYETYDVIVSALGLNEQRINGVQIFDGITSLQDIYLTAIDYEDEKTMEIPPNTLWQDYPPNVSDSQNNEDIAPIVLKEVVIPPYIIVHDGIPSNTNAPNYTVPFTDYIKNVASSEIYSTWPTETIKANVLAIISFTLNRIYTEWYRSRGYDFTITSTTSYDQKYTRRGTIFEPISKIVDEIYAEYIRKGIRLEPLLAHYKNDTTETGYLSQWGSKELGDKGYNALQILQYYYGNEVNTYRGEISENYPYSFSNTLKEKDCGIEVYFLQNALNYIHGSYPAIPIISNPNGYFDEQTTKAVKSFQNIFSLDTTGEVNYQTWYKISYILTATQNLTKSIYN